MSTVFIHNRIILFYDLPSEQSPQCFLQTVLAWWTSEQILSRLDMFVQLVAGSSTQVPGLWTSIDVWEVKKYYTCILKGKKLCKTLSALKCGTATNECKKNENISCLLLEWVVIYTWKICYTSTSFSTLFTDTITVIKCTFDIDIY